EVAEKLGDHGGWRPGGYGRFLPFLRSILVAAARPAVYKRVVVLPILSLTRAAPRRHTDSVEVHMRRLLPLLAVLLFVPALRAADPPKKVVTIEGVTEYQLANGARVLLFPEASRPTITVNMTVLVGSRHEGYGETGMAHLLEHMVFK